MMKLVFGVGINDADYTVSPMVNGKRKRCPYYVTWMNMLTRCYSPIFQAKNPTYAECEVCDEWHSFMAFRAWMETQDWENKQLDKDLVGVASIYSPDTCRFIPKWLNVLFTDHRAARGKLPQGVSRKGNAFETGVRMDGRRVTRRHETVESAQADYLDRKAAYVRSKYNLLDTELRQACEIQLGYLRFPILKQLCR